ncbi:hypothetical protein HanIR_Chr12g0615481 [Helianthus annuus]|nr:hypothetical protein HanIR_Chr12g0615481 [Helianthus annuus]
MIFEKRISFPAHYRRHVVCAALFFAVYDRLSSSCTFHTAIRFNQPQNPQIFDQLAFHNFRNFNRTSNSRFYSLDLY